MTVKDLVAALLQFDQDNEMLCQVVGTKEGAWNVGFSLSKPDHTSFVVMTIQHPQIEYLPMYCAQPVKYYECDKGHHFLGLPDHPVVLGRVMCPHCAAKGGVIVP